MKTAPPISIKGYAFVFVTLLGLTLVTTGLAFIDLGAGLNTVAAIGIAVCKALLVILYFMHVRYSDRLTWVFVAAGFFWLLILIGGTMDDVLTRQWLSPISEEKTWPSPQK
ncbi:MAG: cytochrome C oxidase subunit IV family protein [Deltaproteobacteria bacterium]|nr:cytochrome C oxidase subunit IV family protein [Deltaproteobacteria bacterium]